MADSLNPIINTVSRFCGEHAHILMISGIAVIVLVIIAAVAAGRRRRSKQDPAAEEQEGQKLDSGPAEPLEQQGSCTGPAQDEQPESYEKPAAKVPSITDGHGISGHACTEMEQTRIYHGKIESLLEEISGMTGGNLEEIEIKIQGAEVRIRYSGKRPSQKMTGSCNPCCPDGEREAQEVIGEKIMPDDISGEISQGCCDTYDGGQDGCGGTQMPPKVKKFGPDNINRTRSGKIFTEQELSQKIRD